MRLAGAEYSIRKKAYDIFISGCTRNCYNCFNKEVQDFNFGTLIDTETIQSIITKVSKNVAIVSRLRIMGGDLLCNPDAEAHAFITRIKRDLPKCIALVLYTGANKEDIPEWCFDLFDEIKYGSYDDALHCDSDLYGSTNQHYIIKDKQKGWKEIV